ncbi:MAG: hypothetical protein IJ870_00430 [Alphaproteobacteria bacterium]|nr:hypothetical protein [Alphaproteobacteria bacterium]
MTEFDLEKTINSLLTPQEILSPFIFDADGKMQENVRQDLLKIAHKIVELTIFNTQGLEIEDICLTGSLSGYLYHEKSDIDMRIVVKNKNCHDLKKTKASFDAFLSTQFSFYRAKNYRFIYKKKLVDTKMSFSNIDFISLYSLIKNQWIIKPDKDTFKHISKKRLLNYYQKRKNEILEEFEYIKKQYIGTKLCDELDAFYARTVLNKPTLKDHLVYKILSKEHIFKQIARSCTRTQCAILSLHNEYQV